MILRCMNRRIFQIGIRTNSVPIYTPIKNVCNFTTKSIEDDYSEIVVHEHRIQTLQKDSGINSTVSMENSNNK